jgi:hypothetical protein
MRNIEENVAMSTEEEREREISRRKIIIEM